MSPIAHPFMTALKPLQIATISDIHLGHKRNPAHELVPKLYRAFPDNGETAELDMIVIVGDLFDSLLIAPNETFSWADPWIGYMLRLCAKHDIVLRVLEGTPSHDWKQSERFNTIESIVKSGCDFKYVKELAVEYIESLGLHVLYVPDEWETTTEKTLEQAQALIRAKGLQQVDFAFMHGQFEHQLPEFVRAQKHSSAEYLKLVKHLIFIGHVHTHSHYERIHAQGSFDRLAQNEEGPKGHLRAQVIGNEYNVRFIENTEAKRFVTVDCQHLSLEDTLARIDQAALRLPEGSYVRVRGDETNPIFSSMEELIRRWPLLVWSKDVVSPDTPSPETARLQESETYVPITLTKDNLGSLLLERLVLKHVPTAEVLAAAEEILKETL